jgi:hypothetical protein
MDADRFDRMTKTLSTAASRRLALRGLSAALAASLHLGVPNSSLVIAERAGGSGNQAIIGGRGRHHDRDHHRSRSDRKRNDPACHPKPRRKLCRGKCDQIVNDACGGKIDCACKGGTVCAASTGECCARGQLCVGKSVCCPEGEVCGPGDACCPTERACFPSNTCCAAGEECTRGGGTCCPLPGVCRVGGVAAACCSGLNQQCVNGVCQTIPPP